MEAQPLTIWTVGHSNRTLEDLLRLLEPAGITLLADVRRFPGSRRHPQFAQRALAATLPPAGIRYAHFGDLGGHREPVADSLHTAIREPAFRGYAEHMSTPDFRSALVQLLALARENRTAIMCAEARWQDCHRKLLADSLVVAGARVVHLVPGIAPVEHLLHCDARVVTGALLYRRPEQLELGDWSTSKE